MLGEHQQRREHAWIDTRCEAWCIDPRAQPADVMLRQHRPAGGRGLMLVAEEKVRRDGADLSGGTDEPA